MSRKSVTCSPFPDSPTIVKWDAHSAPKRGKNACCWLDQMTMGDQIGGSCAPVCTHPPSSFVPRKGAFPCPELAGGQPHLHSPFRSPLLVSGAHAQRVSHSVVTQESLVETGPEGSPCYLLMPPAVPLGTCSDWLSLQEGSKIFRL